MTDNFEKIGKFEENLKKFEEIAKKNVWWVRGKQARNQSWIWGIASIDNLLPSRKVRYIYVYVHLKKSKVVEIELLTKVLNQIKFPIE